MSYYQSLLLLLLFLAALADLKTNCIPNGFLAAGMAIGMTGSLLYGPGIADSAASVSLAFLLLYPLFKIGALGAGDIKVLMMAGSFLSVKDFLAVLAAAFVTGAVFSLAKLLAEHNGRERMFYLLYYVSDVIRNRRWRLYGEDMDAGISDERICGHTGAGGGMHAEGREKTLKKDQNSYCRNKIHFTIPVLFGAALKLGGVI